MTLDTLLQKAITNNSDKWKDGWYVCLIYSGWPNATQSYGPYSGKDEAIAAKAIVDESYPRDSIHGCDIYCRMNGKDYKATSHGRLLDELEEI